MPFDYKALGLTWAEVEPWITTYVCLRGAPDATAQSVRELVIADGCPPLLAARDCEALRSGLPFQYLRIACTCCAISAP